MAEHVNSTSTDSASLSEDFEIVCATGQPELEIANNGDIEQLRLSLDEVLKTDINPADPQTLHCDTSDSKRTSIKGNTKVKDMSETDTNCVAESWENPATGDQNEEHTAEIPRRLRASTADDALHQVQDTVENREVRSSSLPEPLKFCLSPKKQDPKSTVFDDVTYLGCAAIDAPRSETEVARNMNILSSEQDTDQAIKIAISVPCDCDGSVILKDPEGGTEIANFKINQIIFCCRGKQDGSEASCFAFTCSHGKSAETSIFQCHVFDCHTSEHVGQVLLSFASAFSKVTNKNSSSPVSKPFFNNIIRIPTPSTDKIPEDFHTFEVTLEIQEEDSKLNFIAVPWDKNYFKFRCDSDKKLILTVQQIGSNHHRLSIEKCFGLLICPGRNVKNSDMQLLEMVSMGSSEDLENSYIVCGFWDPTDPVYEVLNTETPKDTRVYLTVAVDLVIKGIQEPVRLSLDTKAKIFPKNERFWYFSKKVLQENFIIILKHLIPDDNNIASTSNKYSYKIISVESESEIERKRKSMTLNLTNAGARAAVQSVQTPCDPETESDTDEPLLSGSGIVSKDCSVGELEGWAEVLAKWRQNLKLRPKQLISLVRRGIPEALRGEVWQLLAKCYEDSKEKMEMYRILITKDSQCESTILRDINRTFPAHEFFRENGGLGQDSLYKISKAYSVYDEEVGYCQGLSFLAAALLLHMPEEQAFCLQVKIMFQYQLRDLFKQGFEELYLKFYQLERLLEDQIPELFSHFVELGIEAHMYGSQWFLTLFTAKFPLCLVYFILDLFLLDGMDTIFQIALGLLLMSKDDLLALDFEGILKYFRVSLPKKYRSDENTRQLISTAVKIKVKKLKKYEKEFHIIKEQESLQQDPLERLEKENKRLLEANMRLEQENDDLAHELVTSKINLRNLLDAAEDRRKKRLEVESSRVKDMFHRELKNVEEENSRNKAIIAEYKQICNQLSDRIEKEQKGSKEIIKDMKAVLDSCTSCSKQLKGTRVENILIKKLSRDMSEEKIGLDSNSDVEKRIRELELELAQTKLALVEAECKNQDSTHQLNAALAELQSSKHTWFQKTITSLKEVTKQKEQAKSALVPSKILTEGAEQDNNSGSVSTVLSTYVRLVFLHYIAVVAKTLMRFAGHVMRGSSGDLLNLILEGSIEGVRDRGRQRRTWGDDVKEWSRTTSIGDAKRTAESRENWRGIVANLRNGEGTA
ncbi:Rab GTPase-activating protein 1 [Nymphon striatum]|nr:Rab GTPase-activating protein 1 [Nymphon striatum]